MTWLVHGIYPLKMVIFHSFVMLNVLPIGFSPGSIYRGQVQWSVETTKGLVDSVKTTAHGKLQETLTSIKGTYVTR
jgi:hypothetical protein